MGFALSTKAFRKLWKEIFSRNAPSTAEGKVKVVSTAVDVETGVKANDASIDESRSNAPISTGNSIHAENIAGFAPTAMPVISTADKTGGGYVMEVPLEGRGTSKTVGRQMFGDNNLVQGGEFVEKKTVIVNNNGNSERAGSKLLQKRVATSASHNSAQTIDPPRCHPNTREPILKQVYDWIWLDFFVRQTWLMWMHGAAGAGKSAIMQSIAELCVQEGIAVASFFFSRTDDTRNTMAPFVATLVYQLIQAIPQTEDEIVSIIEHNPLIFEQALQFQLEQLIIQPILRLHGDLQRLFVILIDGLDECTDRGQQSNLIKVLGNISKGRNIPAVFLVASRRESQIETAFGQTQVSNLLVTLPLDDTQASDDIRRYLKDKFQEITATHLRRHLLPGDWPPESVLEEIVDKSSGQFIFASVVVNYVSSPRANPANQLEVIRGIRLRDPSSQDPFAHLDALYRHIFSQVEALDNVLDILSCILLITKWQWTKTYENILLLPHGEVEVCLTDLAAVIECYRVGSYVHIKFLHASLPDFLLDGNRSGIYYRDLEVYRMKLLCALLERPPLILDSLSFTNNLDVVSEKEYWRLMVIQYLLARVNRENVSDELQAALMKFKFTFYDIKDFQKNNHNCTLSMAYVKDLDEPYLHFLNLLAAGYVQYWPSLDDNVKIRVNNKYPDVMARIRYLEHCRDGCRAQGSGPTDAGSA